MASCYFFVDETPDGGVYVELVDRFRETYLNGGCLFGIFGVHLTDERDHLSFKSDAHRDAFVLQMLTSEALSRKLPGLAPATPESVRGLFHRISPFVWQGELLGALVAGSAYPTFTGPIEEAEELVERFRLAIMDRRYTQVEVLSAAQGWSQWFRGDAWDHSWIVIDPVLRRAAILGLTDID